MFVCAFKTTTVKSLAQKNRTQTRLVRRAANLRLYNNSCLWLDPL